MTDLDKQIIRSILHTLTDLTYQTLIKLEKQDKSKTEKDVELLENYRETLFKLIDIKLFKEE